MYDSLDITEAYEYLRRIADDNSDEENLLRRVRVEDGYAYATNRNSIARIKVNSGVEGDLPGVQCHVNDEITVTEEMEVEVDCNCGSGNDYSGIYRIEGNEDFPELEDRIVEHESEVRNSISIDVGELWNLARAVTDPDDGRVKLPVRLTLPLDDEGNLIPTEPIYVEGSHGDGVIAPVLDEEIATEEEFNGAVEQMEDFDATEAEVTNLPDAGRVVDDGDVAPEDVIALRGDCPYCKSEYLVRFVPKGGGKFQLLSEDCLNPRCNFGSNDE